MHYHWAPQLRWAPSLGFSSWGFCNALGAPGGCEHAGKPAEQGQQWRADASCVARGGGQGPGQAAPDTAQSVVWRLASA